MRKLINRTLSSLLHQRRRLVYHLFKSKPGDSVGIGDLEGFRQMHSIG